MRLHGIELNPGAVIRNANIQSGSILPDTNTTEGQLFFNVEGDTLYVRNAANTQWNAIGSYTLSDLTDVEVGGAEHGQALIYDEVSEKWKPGAGGGGEGATFLNELADVDTSETTLDGNVLGYDEATGNWIGVPNDGAVSVITNNVATDGTFSHDDGSGTIVTISLNSQDLPFNDESVADPVLVSDNVRDAINEVKDLVISKQAISTMVDNMATSGTIAHNDGQGTGVVIDLNSDSIPFESGYSPSEIEADNVRDALDEIHQIASNLFIYEDTTFYIDPTGDDITGDGSEGNPWYSPHRAFDFLNDKILGEGALITISVGGGDYVFNKSIEIRHLQGSQIELIGAALLGNRPSGFKLPDFSDPHNPVQDPRGVDDIYATIIALDVDADDATRTTVGVEDMVNNRALLRDRFNTRFLFKSYIDEDKFSWTDHVGLPAIIVHPGCGINLVDNIMLSGEWPGYVSGNWDHYLNEGAIHLTQNSFATIGVNVAILDFSYYAFIALENSTLNVKNPLVFNTGRFVFANGGSNVIAGDYANYANGPPTFTHPSDVSPSIIFAGGNRYSNYTYSLNGSSIEAFGCSFLGGVNQTSGILASFSSTISIPNCCFIGTSISPGYKGLVEAIDGSTVALYTYALFFANIKCLGSGAYLFRAENADITMARIQTNNTYIKGCNIRIANATSNGSIRLMYPKLENNYLTEVTSNYSSNITLYGGWDIPDSNEGISFSVLGSSYLYLQDAPGEGTISANTVLNTAYNRLTRDGSYIGTYNLDSVDKKWQIVETDMTVVEGDRMLVNADSADVTITLPSSPKDSDEVIFRMIRNNNGANAFLINPGAETINDVAGVSNVGDVLHRDLTLVYHTYGWWATGGNVDGGTY